MTLIPEAQFQAVDATIHVARLKAARDEYGSPWAVYVHADADREPCAFHGDIAPPGAGYVLHCIAQRWGLGPGREVIIQTRFRDGLSEFTGLSL